MIYLKHKILALLLLCSLLPTPLALTLKAAEKPLLMAYIHAKTNYSELVASTNGALDEVSVDWLGVNAAGELLIDEKKYNAAFIEEMHQKGVRVLPMLSNAFDRQLGITALKNAAALTTAIAEMVYERNFDGICYDFENVSENERDLQTAFVKLLRQKMPDKVISVAVAANPSGWSKGWHASYDMQALAEYADYLMVMAYDEGYSGGPEKPVASISWVERCIQDVLNRGAAADKVVLGIPLYGRMWSADGTQLGLGVELVQANRMLQDPALRDKEISYDETAQTAKLSFTATTEYPLYTWKNIPAGKYTLYYENERSLQQKISLLHKYNLKGLGFWSLGQADASIWNSIVPYSQGRFYNDIRGHWAEIPINHSISSGWMRWIGESDFLPEQPVYRDQVAAALNGFFQLSVIDAAYTHPFADLSAEHWAWDSVQAVVYQGMMSGMDQALTRFGPGEPFTRAQFASIFDRLLTAFEQELGQSIDWTALPNPYSDLPTEHWSRIPLLRMVERGLLAGYDVQGEQLMKPDTPISRAELAVMLQRMQGLFVVNKEGWHVSVK